MMNERRPPRRLSGNHHRGISISLQLLDKALCRWSEWVEGRVASGPLYQPQDSLSCAEKDELAGRMKTIRGLIIEMRDDLKLAVEAPATTRLIAAEATVLWEMLAEMTSSGLRGYGVVGDDLAAYLDPRAEILMTELHAISTMFSKTARS
jgi:hypothetical protein